MADPVARGGVQHDYRKGLRWLEFAGLQQFADLQYGIGGQYNPARFDQLYLAVELQHGPARQQHLGQQRFGHDQQQHDHQRFGPAGRHHNDLTAAAQDDIRLPAEQQPLQGVLLLHHAYLLYLRLCNVGPGLREPHTSGIQPLWLQGSDLRRQRAQAVPISQRQERLQRGGGVLHLGRLRRRARNRFKRQLQLFERDRHVALYRDGSRHRSSSRWRR